MSLAFQSSFPNTNSDIGKISLETPLVVPLYWMLSVKFLPHCTLIWPKENYKEGETGSSSKSRFQIKAEKGNDESTIQLLLHEFVKTHSLQN